MPSMPAIGLTRLISLGCELSNSFVLRIELCKSRSHPGLKLVGALRSLMVRCLTMYVLQSSDLVERELQGPQALLMHAPQLLYCIAVHCISWACGVRISGPRALPCTSFRQYIVSPSTVYRGVVKWDVSTLGYLVLPMSVLQALYCIAVHGYHASTFPCPSFGCFIVLPSTGYRKVVKVKEVVAMVVTEKNRAARRCTLDSGKLIPLLWRTR